MPCDDSHLEPTKREEENRKAAELLCFLIAQDSPSAQAIKDYVDRELHEGVESVYKASRSEYGQEGMIALLCEALSHISEAGRQSLIYDQLTKSRKARELANWWEDHLEEDRKKREREKEVTLCATITLKRKVYKWFLGKVMRDSGLNPESHSDFSKAVSKLIELMYRLDNMTD